MGDPLIPDHVDLAHPVIRRSYSLFTPAIQVLADTVRDWIDRRIKGGTIFGPSQFGKSSAVLNWLGKLLDERLKGSVQLIVWVHQDHGSSTSPRSFFSRLLSAANEGAKVRRDAATVHHQLVERLIQLANSNSSRYVVLVIDEAQSMTQREWLWLVQLHATLEAEGVLLCVISIASLQFNEKPRELAMTGSAHAAARFMLFESQFHGMRSADEISYVLSGYDEDTEWPEGSRICFTAGLAPRAYAEGFRIGTYGAHLWATLHDCLPVGYGGPEEIPLIPDGGFNIALASRYVLNNDSGAFGTTQHALLAIRSDRIARFVSEDDVTHLQVTSSLEELLAQDWDGPFTNLPMKKRLAKLVKEVGKRGAVDLSSVSISKAGSPVRLKARWLLAPVDEARLISTFADHQPWRLEDYPGIKKSERDTFWARTFSPVSVHAFFGSDTIFFNLYTPQSAFYPHSQVQAGVGGLRYISRTEGIFSVKEPGYYLVKYGNQPRGHSPILGMDDTLAAQVREATGLSGTYEETSREFFSSDAGLALAKWAATFPRRASNVGVANTYTGFWYDTVKLRMEFELTRAGALD